MAKEMTLNETFEALDEVVQKLSADEVSLEDSFALYHQGMILLKECNQKIDTVEKQIMVLDENGEEHEFAAE